MEEENVIDKPPDQPPRRIETATAETQTLLDGVSMELAHSISTVDFILQHQLDLEQEIQEVFKKYRPSLTRKQIATSTLRSIHLFVAQDFNRERTQAGGSNR